MEAHTKVILDLMAAVYERAVALGIDNGSQFACMMDLDAAHEHFNMRLNDWLQADDFNFAHDFTGIQQDINRSNGCFSGRFLPRFCGEKKPQRA